LTNTIFFGELFGTCGSSGSITNLSGSLWANATGTWRPTICAWGGGKSGGTNYPTCPVPQSNPNWMQSCDPGRSQSAHSGGVNCGIGDGSARFVRASIDPVVWANACHPIDGNVINGDF